MNKARRKEIAEIVEIMRGAVDRLEFVQNEEQEAFDNLSEGLQATERGETMENAVSEIETAVNSVTEAIDAIEML